MLYLVNEDTTYIAIANVSRMPELTLDIFLLEATMRNVKGLTRTH